MAEMLPVLAVAVLLGVVVVAVRASLRPLERRIERLSRIEGKLDAILKHSGVRFDPLEGLPGEAIDAVRQGRKIEAINGRLRPSNVTVTLRGRGFRRPRT